jgi:DNA-binding NarL/FixJ family response regulator
MYASLDAVPAPAPPSLVGSRSSGPLKLTVVSDDTEFGDTLWPVLEEKGVAVFKGVTSRVHAEPTIARERPDLVLILTGVADGDALNLSSRLAEVSPDTAILLHCDARDVLGPEDVLHRGASGVVSRRSNLQTLARAILAVGRGGFWFDEDTGFKAARQRAANAGLSRRELDVLSSFARGRSNEEIAGLLGISPHTVRTHLRNVIAKLEARGRTHCVAIAISLGLIPPVA